jgi:hypothetical protein
MIETETDLTLKEIEITDTINEDDLIKQISNFISKNRKIMVRTFNLSEFLVGAFGISPQFVPEIEGKIQLPKGCNPMTNQRLYDVQRKNRNQQLYDALIKITWAAEEKNNHTRDEE